MPFKGEVLSIGALLDRSREDTGGPSAARGPSRVRHTAASNARRAADLLAAGERLDEAWRFGVLQTLDDYTSAVRRGGVALGRGVFAEEPARTGSVELDAAFAALADHLAERDGWMVPAWALDPARAVAPWWYPAVPAIFRDEAEQESPRAFRQRGILITGRSLARA